MERPNLPKRILSIKLLLYVVGGFAGIGVGLLLVGLIGRNQAPENSPLMMFALILLFAIAPLGALWMVKMVIRQEKGSLPLILIALFVPFAFLWYYFERIRPCRSTREPAGE